MDITEDEVKLVTWKLSGSLGSGGTESEALQGWLLKFGDNSKRLHTSVETFADWIANNIPPCAAYFAFMSGRLIALDKQPGVCTVGVGETWRHLFAKCVLRVTGPEATRAFQYDHICDVLKAGIRGTVNGVQAIWYTKLTTEDCEFLLVDTKTLSTRSIR